jgi:endonuclease/exonuclease/phosphatase family metal-dependent hydrolase
MINDAGRSGMEKAYLEIKARYLAEKKLEIGFFNCFLRAPSGLFWDKQDQRVPLIAEWLLTKPCDIYGLCEVMGSYDTKLAKHFEDKGYEFISLKKYPSLSSIYAHNGLAIAFKKGRFKVKDISGITFESCENVDCLMQKGAVSVTMEDKLFNKTFNVVVTHMQSYYNDRNKRKVSFEQMKQLHTFMKDGGIIARPFILLGDLNICPDSLKELSTLFEVPLSLPATKLPTTVIGKCIDYIIATNCISVEPTQHVHKPKVFLSDHYYITRGVVI